MRTIHYSLRIAVVLILASLLYWGVTAILHQPFQIVALITILCVAIFAERLGVLLEWIGPVVGSVNVKEQEQEQNRMVEYIAGNSLRYKSPLVIAALRSRKRISLHVVARCIRKSDMVFRNSAGYLLILMPFTTLEQAPVAFERLSEQLPLQDIVVADVNMLRTLVAQHASGTGEVREISARDLRRICIEAFDARVAAIPPGEEKSSAPAIYNLIEGSASGQLDTTSHPDSEQDSPLRAEGGIPG